jgi:hypothetical protein
MYDFVDRRVTDLDHGGRFLIWSMRRWTGAMSEQRCPGGAIGGAFARWRMIAGLQPFLRMMALLNRHGLETFRFCPLGCNRVAEHEAIVLSLVRGLHDAPGQALRDTLALLVEDDAIGDILAALSAFGCAMDQAAIFPARPLSPDCRNRPL